MKNKIFSFVILLVTLLFCSCQKASELPVLSQPQVFQSTTKDTVDSKGSAVIIGPLKDYEQGSDVVYQLKVSSALPLTKFSVSTTSDVFSHASHIIKTEPENAIDASGNFAPGIKEVVIYYAYRIDDSILPLTNVTTAFALQNESNYVGSTSDNFMVIKKGSTNGKLLTVQELSYLRPDRNGIGTQETFAFIVGNKAEFNSRAQYKRGPFYSLEQNRDLGTIANEAVLNADKFNFVGYFPRTKGTNPVLNASQFYLVSPSDTAVLANAFVGARQGGLSLLGNSGTGRIEFAGLTKLVTYSSNANTTVANFVNANKADYAAKGFTLTGNAANLYWTTAIKGAQASQAEFTNLTGTLQVNPYYAAGEGGTTFRKAIDLRLGIQEMARKLKRENRTFKTTYFKRLDNLTGAGKLSAAEFDVLTHDNELDGLLEGIVEGKNTIAGQMSWDEVYGFVSSDGTRGLIRTLPKSYLSSAGVVVANAAVNTGDLALYCTIKYQKEK